VRITEPLPSIDTLVSHFSGLDYLSGFVPRTLLSLSVTDDFADDIGKRIDAL
jgi:hypothetical protein